MLESEPFGRNIILDVHYGRPPTTATMNENVETRNVVRCTVRTNYILIDIMYARPDNLQSRT